MNIKKIVRKAYKNRYGIGAFNICNLETFQAVVEGSKETKMPVFMQTSMKTINYMGIDNIVSLYNGLKRTQAILHLDHGNFKSAKECIRKGYPSIMFDGSAFNFEKNKRLTKEIAKIGHDNGVFVEGEIGALKVDGLTDPIEAEEFAKETEVDILAISIGNRHGFYELPPVLDIKRLIEIKERVDVPLVLHGGSGISDGMIVESIKNGITKINIDTELRWEFTSAVRMFLNENSMNQFDKSTFDIRNYLAKGRDAFKKRVIEKIELFSRKKLINRR